MSKTATTKHGVRYTDKKITIMKNKLGFSLLACYLILFTLCAIEPFDRDVWWAENIPIVIIVAGIIFMHKYHRFSGLGYAAMSVLIVLHTIGGHFTFERVPFGFVTELFGFERNHYDRVAHFSVGFYAYAIAEVVLKMRLVNSRAILLMFPIFAIFTVAGSYEVFEWQYAVMADPMAGLAVLGSQGDIWDAQKDILADGLGAIVAMMIFFALNRKEILKLG